jgi:hypothetical protein
MWSRFNGKKGRQPGTKKINSEKQKTEEKTYKETRKKAKTQTERLRRCCVFSDLLFLFSSWFPGFLIKTVL